MATNMSRRNRFSRAVIALTLATMMIPAQPLAAMGETVRPTAPKENPLKHQTQEQREAAAARMKVQKAATTDSIFARSSVQAAPVAAVSLEPTQGGIPDYFSDPNWAFSPPLEKFVDSLPGLGAENANNLGQYINVAVPDTTTYPGSDYYEIGLVEYTEQMHSDLPPTTLRGYVQLNDPANPATKDANGTVIDWPTPHHLGPFIMSRKDRPVRVKFTNLLPTGTEGDLFIPVDTTVMGAGMGPLMHEAMPMNYTQNRATLHLHGGKTPWISDGTPHQWITPAGEDTDYPEGVSVQNVPDMPDPGDGSMTFFYTNQQSARLMFYHDHSMGITRLNVYAGEAAGYMISDEAEDKLVADGLVPSDQIPLIIEDKTFVDASTVLKTDPTWNWGTGAKDLNGYRAPVTGDLWYPHVYSPAQNPADDSGMNAFGRWHYGPWFWPPTTGVLHPPMANPYYDPINAPWENETIPPMDNPSMVGEAFMDTPLVNGTAFPTLEVDPKSYRLRILNAASDRFWNLQMYEADPTLPVERIFGESKFDTSAEIALAAYPDGAQTVILTTGNHWADATGGSALAGVLDAPMMLVDYSSIPASVAAALKTLAPQNIVILGGTLAVSAAVESSLGSTYNVERIAGATQYDTADMVAERVIAELEAAGTPWNGMAFFATGTTFQDSVSVSPLAAKMKCPVFLVKPDGLTTAAQEMLDATGPRIENAIILGGTLAVPATVEAQLAGRTVERLSGLDWWDTSAAIAQYGVDNCGLTWQNVAFATGDQPYDALVGGILQAKRNSVILLTRTAVLNQAIADTITANREIRATTYFGGDYAVSPAVRSAIAALLADRANTEVQMVPAAATAGFPATWPTDGREGGVPDPATAGPKWIQIGTESGFLPKPAVIDQQPVTWNNDPTTFNFGNVDLHSLLIAPAERADVVVDFSKYAGKTLIVYNDAPAAFPALDARLDYYTGAPDLTSTGGTTGAPIGYGPNTRTILQIKVKAAAPAAAFNLTALNTAFASTATEPGVFAASQNPIIVPEARYNEAYNKTFSDSFVRIFETFKTFLTVAGDSITVPFQPKAIQDEMGEAFDAEYGRMMGKLGVELPNTNAQNQNFVLQNYSDPSTEMVDVSAVAMSPVQDDGTQIWKITHNGVDTHPIHFHLFDVQLVNRVGWDNGVRPPDDNELGWKETVRVSPLEDTIVALRPVRPNIPFGVPDSIRRLNPTMPADSTEGFTSIDPLTGQPLNPVTTNAIVNFRWEYMWHCHILSHEEMEMMRPVVANVSRELAQAPVVNYSPAVGGVGLTWTDGTPVSDPATWGNPTNEIEFRIERADVATPETFVQIGKALANATSYVDTTAVSGQGYLYRVVAHNAAGDTASIAIPVTP